MTAEEGATLTHPFSMVNCKTSQTLADIWISIFFSICCRSDEFGCPVSAVLAPHADSAAEDLQWHNQLSRLDETNRVTEVKQTYFSISICLFCFFFYFILFFFTAYEFVWFLPLSDSTELHTHMSGDFRRRQKSAETENFSCFQSQHQQRPQDPKNQRYSFHYTWTHNTQD